MKLSTQDVDLFYRLQWALLAYTNRQLKLTTGAQTPDEVKGLELKEKARIRDGLWENAGLISSFVGDNPYKFSEEELSIIDGWRHFIKGRFLLVSYLKNYAVFVDQGAQIPFGVVALTEDFEDMLGPHLPLYLETVLLPFKGRIIYDGLVAPYSITFGGGARRNITDSYQQAKAKYGIVTSLPFSTDSKGQSDEDLLRFYLKNQQNRDRYWDDIWALIRKKPVLRLLYHQEMGKVHARTYKKRLRDIGMDKGWFAVLEAMIVAVGSTREEAERTVKSLVPSEKKAWVYYFRLDK